MHDALLNLVPVTTFTGAATSNGTAMALGRNRVFRSKLRVDGIVTGSGTPTITVSIQEAATAGGSYTTIAAFTGQTAANVSVVSGVARPEIPTALEPQTVTFNTSLDFVRAVVVVSGTTPVFTAVSVTVAPIAEGYKRSAVA
jgi:hypothetical protein